MPCRRRWRRSAPEAAGSFLRTPGGVLPGVTVTALHEATGNTFVAVTDERGISRIPARVGSYQINAVLQGFATVERTAVLRNLQITQCYGRHGRSGSEGLGEDRT